MFRYSVGSQTFKSSGARGSTVGLTGSVARSRNTQASEHPSIFYHQDIGGTIDRQTSTSVITYPHIQTTDCNPNRFWMRELNVARTACVRN
eukprot:3573623-Amphidinium_carterae.2